MIMPSKYGLSKSLGKKANMLSKQTFFQAGFQYGSIRNVVCMKHMVFMWLAPPPGPVTKSEIPETAEFL